LNEYAKGLIERQTQHVAQKNKMLPGKPAEEFSIQGQKVSPVLCVDIENYLSRHTKVS
jgi:hypothetical protein